MFKNIDNLGNIEGLNWTVAQSTSGFFRMNWYVPNREFPHLKFSNATMSLVAKKILGENSGFNVYLNLKSLAVKDPELWRHTPFVLEVTVLVEKAGQWICEVHPISDSIGFPTVVLIDESGQIVPWVRVTLGTDVKVLFLTANLDNFAYDVSEIYTVIALQFAKGRCHVPYKGQQKYRDRLARIIKQATTCK